MQTTPAARFYLTYYLIIHSFYTQFHGLRSTAERRPRYPGSVKVTRVPSSTESKQSFMLLSGAFISNLLRGFFCLHSYISRCCLIIWTFSKPGFIRHRFEWVQTANTNIRKHKATRPDCQSQQVQMGEAGGKALPFKMPSLTRRMYSTYPTLHGSDWTKMHDCKSYVGNNIYIITKTSFDSITTKSCICWNKVVTL